MCLLCYGLLKLALCKKNYIYSFRASVSHRAYIALLNLRVHRTQSLFAAFIICISEEDDTEQLGGFFVDVDY